MHDGPRAPAWASAGIRRAVWTLFAVQLLLALANLPLIVSDERDNRSWRSEHAGRHGEMHGERVNPPPGIVPGPLHEWVKLYKQELDLDQEKNVATWFAVFQLALAGGATLALGAVTRRRGWTVVGLALLALSCDEMAMLHEWMGEQLSDLGWTFGTVLPPYPWVIVLGPLLIGFAGWMMMFVYRALADRPHLRLRVWIAIALMAAVLPLEYVGGLLQALTPHPPRIEVILEETLETAGVTLILWVVLDVLVAALAARMTSETSEGVEPLQRVSTA